MVRLFMTSMVRVTCGCRHCRRGVCRGASAIDGNVIKVVSTQRTLQGKHRKSARNATIFVQPSQLMKAEEAQDVAYSFLISLDCRKKKREEKKRYIWYTNFCNSLLPFAVHNACKLSLHLGTIFQSSMRARQRERERGRADLCSFI